LAIITCTPLNSEVYDQLVFSVYQSKLLEIFTEFLFHLSLNNLGFLYYLFFFCCLQLAKKLHPDTNKGDTDSERKFQEVQRAYEVILPSVLFFLIFCEFSLRSLLWIGVLGRW
jgi:DnaJ domain